MYCCRSFWLEVQIGFNKFVLIYFFSTGVNAGVHLCRFGCVLYVFMSSFELCLCLEPFLIIGCSSMSKDRDFISLSKIKLLSFTHSHILGCWTLHFGVWTDDTRRRLSCLLILVSIYYVIQTILKVGTTFIVGASNSHIN